MARHRRIDKPDEDKPELSISPLIDVCFLLLIYFLVTTTIKQKERDNSMNLPTVQPSEAQPDIEPLFIRVANNGFIHLGTGQHAETLETDPSSTELPKLDARLKSYARGARTGKSEPVIQIFAEEEAKQQRIMSVIDLLKKHEIKTVTFTDLVEEPIKE